MDKAIHSMSNKVEESLTDQKSSHIMIWNQSI